MEDKRRVIRVGSRESRLAVEQTMLLVLYFIMFFL